MALHPVGAADHQQGPVQNLESALHLRGEIHVARGVQQRQLHIPKRQHRLLGKDGDAPLPLHSVRVQKGIPVVHPAQPAQGAPHI